MVPKIGNVVYSFRKIENSLFEVALEELEANFHISPVSTHHLSRLAGGFHLQPWRGRGRGRGSFSNEPPTFTLFPAASAEARPRLPVWNLPEIILARARGDSSRAVASIRSAIRSPGGVATPLASLVTFKLPKPARSFRGLHEFSLSSCLVVSRRDASTCDVYVAAAANKTPELLGVHSAFVWNFT